MSVAERIREVREKAGLKPAEFAARLDVSFNRIVDVERGKQRAADDILAKIVEIFQVDGGWLLTGHHQGAMPDKLLLEGVLEAVEEYIDQERIELAPVKKAQLIHALYEHFAEHNLQIDKTTVVRFIRLVA